MYWSYSGESRRYFGDATHVGHKGLRDSNRAVALLEVFKNGQNNTRNSNSST